MKLNLFIMKKERIVRSLHLLTFTLLLMMMITHSATFAQERVQMVRLAKIVVDSAQLEAYRTFLKEEVEASLRLEPGVITLYPVAEKNRPTHITILEIYADVEAYKAHIQTPHFLKYQNRNKGYG
jgi:4-carboxymuconolactone decarboxylase